MDGNLIGEVKMLVDKELGEPDEYLRLPSWDRFQVIFHQKMLIEINPYKQKFE